MRPATPLDWHLRPERFTDQAAEMGNDVRSLVVGASGQVGTQMLRALGDRALACSRDPRTGWLQLDLAALTGVPQVAALLDAVELDAILCVGGMTHVDGCEQQPELAKRTNAVGPELLARYAQARGLPLLYFSTEYVFDGAATDPGPYREEHTPRPLSVYGRSKLEGEQRVLAAHASALILRTTIVYGPDPRQLNYLSALLRNLRGGVAMRVPEDQVSTPTYNRDLVAAALALLQAGAAGILHVAGPECMSRLEFAERCARHFGLDERLLQPVSTAALAQPAPRPLHAGLATDKLREGYPEVRMRGLAESLSECASEFAAAAPALALQEHQHRQS